MSSRPIRSTRNKNINYAEYDVSYAPEAEYDSDYVPPSAEMYSKRSAPVRSHTASSTVRRSTRVKKVVAKY